MLCFPSPVCASSLRPPPLLSPPVYRMCSTEITAGSAGLRVSRVGSAMGWAPRSPMPSALGHLERFELRRVYLDSHERESAPRHRRRAAVLAVRHGLVAKPPPEPSASASPAGRSSPPSVSVTATGASSRSAARRRCERLDGRAGLGGGLPEVLDGLRLARDGGEGGPPGCVARRLRRALALAARGKA